MWKLCKILNVILNVLICIVKDIFICNVFIDESENGYCYYEIVIFLLWLICFWREIGYYINLEGFFMDYLFYYN